MLKAPCVIKIFTFLYSLFDFADKQLDGKIKINPKVYDVKGWKKIITRHISSNI